MSSRTSLGISDDGGWREYTLHGLVPLDPARPVCHVSGYEAAAYAEWAGARLPTEFELERLARMHPVSAPALRDGSAAHPEALTGEGAEAVFGGVWEWSSSAFERYPGYRPPEGAVGEYNGKFMSGQLVLRGGSCATPEGHVRPTYRNFFPPNARWQFTGLRLARPAG
jgi:formylglycine-generating enzyme required for sulfatase activity